MRTESAQLVASFDVEPKLQLSAGSALLRLESDLSAKVRQIASPREAPVEIPRFLLQAPNLALTVALNRVDLNLTPPTQIAGDSAQFLEYCLALTDRVFPPFFDLGLRYRWAGVVLVYLTKLKGSPAPAIELVTPVFDKLVNVQRRELPLASFQLQYGFTTSGLHKTWTIEGYENRERTTQPSPGSGEQRAYIDVRSLPIVESGLQVTVDINNRDSKEKTDATSDLKSLLGAHREALHEVNAFVETLPVEAQP